MSAEAQSLTYPLIIQVPLLIFGISLNICVLQQVIRKNAAFMTAFYTLYLWQSGSDVCNFMVSNVCGYVLVYFLCALPVKRACMRPCL